MLWQKSSDETATKQVWRQHVHSKLQYGMNTCFLYLAAVTMTLVWSNKAIPWRSLCRLATHRLEKICPSKQKVLNTKPFLYILAAVTLTLVWANPNLHQNGSLHKPARNQFRRLYVHPSSSHRTKTLIFILKSSNMLQTAQVLS